MSKCKGLCKHCELTDRSSRYENEEALWRLHLNIMYSDSSGEGTHSLGHNDCERKVEQMVARCMRITAAFYKMTFTF